MSETVAWTRRAGGVAVTIRLTPRASRDGFDGVLRLSDGTAVLGARVRAVPEKGLANDALRRLLADGLRIPVSATKVLSGDTARRKCILLEGDADLIEAGLRRLAAAKG